MIEDQINPNPKPDPHKQQTDPMALDDKETGSAPYTNAHNTNDDNTSLFVPVDDVADDEGYGTSYDDDASNPKPIGNVYPRRGADKDSPRGNVWGVKEEDLVLDQYFVGSGGHLTGVYIYGPQNAARHTIKALPKGMRSRLKLEISNRAKKEKNGEKTEKRTGYMNGHSVTSSGEGEQLKIGRIKQILAVAWSPLPGEDRMSSLKPSNWRKPGKESDRRG